jgi:predicted  nucleic acid-binding Zn-ribbon protein
MTQHETLMALADDYATLTADIPATTKARAALSDALRTVCAEMERLTKRCALLDESVLAHRAAVRVLREPVEQTLERIANEPPVNGNRLAQSRVLLAAQLYSNEPKLDYQTHYYTKEIP